jgi:hypothetical protein
VLRKEEGSTPWGGVDENAKGPSEVRMTSRKDGALMRARASAPSGAAVAESEEAPRQERAVYRTHDSRLIEGPAPRENPGSMTFVTGVSAHLPDPS